MVSGVLRDQWESFMQSRFKFGSALLLLVVLLLNASGLCVALFLYAPVSRHSCCPAGTLPAQTASAPPCCMLSGAPVAPVSTAVVRPVVSFSPIANIVIRPVLAVKTASAPSLPVPAQQAFLRFHQLLI